MLTPIEIHNKQHKSGRGYSKKEMDDFLEQIAEDYETIYKENRELKDKLDKLSDGIQYYKSMEATLQKALVLAEKTSKETIESANRQAEIIEKEARFKAERIVSHGKDNYEAIRQQCLALIQQYNQFKLQFKQIAIKQIELFDSDFYEIYTNDFMTKINESIDNIESVQQVGQQVEQEVEAQVEQEVEAQVEQETESKSGMNREAESDTIHQTEEFSEVSGDTKEIPQIERNNVKSTPTLNDIIPSAENLKKANADSELTNDNNEEEAVDALIRDLRSELSANVSDVNNSDSAFEFLDSDNL